MLPSKQVGVLCSARLATPGEGHSSHRPSLLSGGGPCVMLVKLSSG